MTFSLDLTQPLGRIGYLANLVFMGVACSAFAWLSHVVMTDTLPGSHAHHEAETVAQTVYADAVAKAKKESKGAALSAEQTAKLKEQATEAGKKKGEEALKHGRETWAPFEIFLLIIAAIFLGGFASIASQRRMNDGGLHGTLWLTAGHLGTWLVSGYLAFLPFLMAHGLAKSWGVALLVGAVLLLPTLLAGEGKGEAHDAH